jgi:preprotein translocase subunit SecE
VTTAAAKGEQRGYFALYKKGQGKWMRWGTVAAMGTAVIVGALWLTTYQLPKYDLNEPYVLAGAALLWIGLGAWLTFWMVNSPKMAEFLIATESEMRKVSWPKRGEVINSTKVIIVITLVLGALLWLVDIGFVKIFQWIHLTS